LIEDANLVLINGLGLDQPSVDFIEAHPPDGRLFMVDFAGNIPSPTTAQPIGGKPIFATDVGDNPHLYLDPVLAQIYAETVSHSLVILDDINEPYYDALFARYKERLQDLDERIASDMTSIPEERRVMITEHSSMVHWASRYGLQVAGTLQDDGEEALSQLLGSKSPPGVFAETGLGDGTLADLANESGVAVCEISTDSVAEDGTAFIAMMESNSTEIRSCLGG
jgi:ABC-type Zn uptake system ZnuABC Zn-binding protein ZnuA